MKIAIIGAGPAGLSAGYSLADGKTDVTVFEKDSVVGGISRTVVNGDFRFDLGGHRFFSKSKEINDFLENLLRYELIDVGRKSRIYFKKRYFDYPLEPRNAVFGLGISTALKILISYISQRIKNVYSRKTVATLEDWVVDKFGRRMFQLYFKSYTEKVWGIPCNEIEAEWVAQRIKGMSLSRAIVNALGLTKKDSPATLIRQFHYPRLGIGRICEKMTGAIIEMNSKVVLNASVVEVEVSGDMVLSVSVKNGEGRIEKFNADQYISSMPITELVRSMRPSAPQDVLNAAEKLKYRDFVAVAAFINRDRVTEDTWLYIHEPDIKFGRIHEPKNWSPYMAPFNKTSLVMEYFCFENDEIWSMPDNKLAKITIDELVNKLKFVYDKEVLGFQVVRVRKAYPMYDIGYSKHLKVLLDYLKNFKNLQLIGRNGTFRYNNMDHSIEMGIKAARRILGEDHDVLNVNSSDEYLEEARS